MRQRHTHIISLRLHPCNTVTTTRKKKITPPTRVTRDLKQTHPEANRLELSCWKEESVKRKVSVLEAKCHSETGYVKLYSIKYQCKGHEKYQFMTQLVFQSVVLSVRFSQLRLILARGQLGTKCQLECLHGLKRNISRNCC